MATFQFGRALLCALLSLTMAAACGPGEDQPDGGTDGGPMTDGGDGGSGNATTIDLHAPSDANPTDYAVWIGDRQDFQDTPVTCGQEVCTYAVKPDPSCRNCQGGLYTFDPTIPGFHTIQKNVRTSYTGKHHVLTWDGPGECGAIVGEVDVHGNVQHVAYKDENRPEWDRVYFRTELACNIETDPTCSHMKVVLNDLTSVGAYKLLDGSHFVVVTGLTFSGRHGAAPGEAGGWQEFSGTISSDRETIVYQLRNHSSTGNDTEEISGTFRRFRQ